MYAPNKPVYVYLLTNGVDIGPTDFVWSGHIVLQVHLLADVHFTGDGGEDESLLSSIRDRKLDLPVQSARSQKSRIQGVGSIGGHYHLSSQKHSLNC